MVLISKQSNIFHSQASGSESDLQAGVLCSPPERPKAWLWKKFPRFGAGTRAVRAARGHVAQRTLGPPPTPLASVTCGEKQSRASSPCITGTQRPHGSQGNFLALISR